MTLSIVLTLLGVALISITIFDIFVTVLHPQAESPFSSRLQTGVWVTMRLLGRGLRGRARHRFLGLGVPLMIAILIGTWLIMLLGAFGLIYASWVSSPGGFRGPTGGQTLNWGDALYFSGVTLATIGYGDIQPVHPLLRIAAVLEGFSGIAILSLSVAYVLEIYPVFQRLRVLAVLLNEETDGQVEGIPMLVRYLRNNNFEALADFLRTINLDLLFLAEAHGRLPILHYIHPTDVERSFLRTLILVRNLTGVLRYVLAGGDGVPWNDDPRVHDLEDSLFYTLHALGSSKQLPLSARVDNNRSQENAAKAFDAVTARLVAANLPVYDDTKPPSGGLSRRERSRLLYSRFFASTDLPLHSYLRNTAYTYSDAARNAVRPQRMLEELEAEATTES